MPDFRQEAYWWRWVRVVQREFHVCLFKRKRNEKLISKSSMKNAFFFSMQNYFLRSARNNLFSNTCVHNDWKRRNCVFSGNFFHCLFRLVDQHIKALKFDFEMVFFRLSMSIRSRNTADIVDTDTFLTRLSDITVKTLYQPAPSSSSLALHFCFYLWIPLCFFLYFGRKKEPIVGAWCNSLMTTLIRAPCQNGCFFFSLRLAWYPSISSEALT